MKYQPRVCINPLALDSGLGQGDGTHTGSRSELDLKSFILYSIIQSSREKAREASLELVSDAFSRNVSR